MKTIASYAEGRDNNFNLIRFLAAWLVLFGHSYVLSRGRLLFSPLHILTGEQPANLAVDVFFITSGFLVSMSFIKRDNPIFFATARVLRIYPALIVAVMLCAFMLGPLFTTLPLADYFRAGIVYEYIAINSVLIADITQLRYYLPAVFESNPYSTTVNGSLWTLPYEMWLYILLLIGGVAGILKRRSLFNVLYVLFLVQYLIGILFFWDIMKDFYAYEKFSMLFLTGAFFYMNRGSVPLNPYLFWLCLIAMYLFNRMEFYPPIYLFALAYSIFWLAYVPAGFIRRFNNLGDYSYGMYIYAFPVQQGILALAPQVTPAVIIVIATGLTLILAALSWHLVEQPALMKKEFASLKISTGLGRLPFLKHLVNGTRSESNEW